MLYVHKYTCGEQALCMGLLAAVADSMAVAVFCFRDGPHAAAVAHGVLEIRLFEGRFAFAHAVSPEVCIDPTDL